MQDLPAFLPFVTLCPLSPRPTTSCLDAALFLRTDLASNRELIEQAVTVEMSAGDMLLFHSRTFHAAGQNLTQDIKRSLVYTYRAADNQPIPETRSANFPDIPMS